MVYIESVLGKLHSAVPGKLCAVCRRVHQDIRTRGPLAYFIPSEKSSGRKRLAVVNRASLALVDLLIYVVGDDKICGFVRIALRLFVPDYDELPPARQAQVRKNINFAVRKAAHVFEYAVLGALLTLLLLEISKRRSRLTGVRYSPAVPLSAAVIIGLIYAATDEAHQIFTGRSSKLSDVLIDLAGVMAGAAAAWLLSRAFSSLRNDKKVKKKQ